ncbi:MAG: acetate--CoA ligase family protein, partial [Desulfotomaculaceae bacterium]|nr:acetate--CoA ligase family protein [Desulfotomaculaceae bacterium]
MLSASDYKKLTAPDCIALVGVTRRTGKGSLSPLEVLLKWGYQGRIYPVNRRGGSILGLQAYPSLLDVPEVPDLAVICAPRDAVLELLEACAAKGVKFVIITAQGFSDGDERGKLMQEEIHKISTRNNIRILGPNTLGIVNNFDHVCTSFTNLINPVKPIGIVCQTGAFYLGAAQFCNGIGVLVDSGNTSDINVTDVLGHLARDPRLKVINIHMEGLRDGQKFMNAAKDATALKPVIIYKTGSSPAGSSAASSHTGSFAGEDRVFDAAFKQCGLLRAVDVEEISDLNKTFSTFNGIKGKHIGVISASGGTGVMAVDACARYGLEIAKISNSTYEQLDELFPEWAKCSNPVDMWPASMFHGFQYSFGRILDAFLEDPQVDAVICMTSSHLEKDEDFVDATGVIREIAGKYPDKPVVACTFGGRYHDYALELEKDNNVVFYFTLDRAARALARLYQYHHLIKTRENQPVLLPEHAGQSQVGKIIAGNSKGNLSQTEALMLLEAYGIPVPRWDIARNVEEAVLAAEEISYPVTMKVLSMDINHKSDVGGVKLNIADSQQLKEAFTEMFREINKKQPGARIDGVVIQKFVNNKGTELLLGCKKDPQFGPVVAFGAGGIFTEIINDVVLRVPPLSKEDIINMINETKVSKILAGARGATAANLKLLTDILTSFIQLVM